MKTTVFKAGLWGIWLIVALLVLGLSTRDLVLNTVLQKKLAHISKKVGYQIEYEQATLKSFNQVSIRGVRVGQSRWVTIPRLEVYFQMNSWLSLKPSLKKIYLIEPQWMVRGNNLKDAFRQEIKRFERIIRRIKTGSTGGITLKKRSSSKPTVLQSPSLSNLNQNVQKWLNRLPYIEVMGGSLVGASGELNLHHLQLHVQNGFLDGSWFGQRPLTRQCSFRGDFKEFKIACERVLSLPVHKRIQVAGRQMVWTQSPFPQLRLQGIQVFFDQDQEQLPFSSLNMSLLVGLKENQRGERPIQLEFHFPGGGHVQAKGTTSKQSGRLQARVDGFPMTSLSPNLAGFFSANVEVDALWEAGQLEMRGSFDGSQMIVEHPSLAEDAIGPFKLNANGLLKMEWVPDQFKRFKVSLEEATVRLNQIQSSFDLSWDQLTDFPHLTGQFKMDRMKAQAFADSIPPRLLPHLQPIELKGKVGFKGEIDLDFRNLKKTVLKFKSNLRGLKVISHNEAIDFESLKTQFETQFELPDGTVFTRQVGPETDRWITLDQVPSYLPQAIIAQEDGGFFKHKGISLFHLRGSLVRNLEKNRFVRGGSTLTMQLTRNLFLNRKKTLSRKLEEICLTWLLEKRLTKEEILTLYINVVEFGTDLFGIKEATALYFNKTPDQLRPEESVALARLLPGPRLYESFFQKKKLSKAYTNRINRMLKLLEKRGHLTADQYVTITPESLWELPPLNLEPDSDLNPNHTTNQNEDDEYDSDFDDPIE